jgi:hypothetical protein
MFEKLSRYAGLAKTFFAERAVWKKAGSPMRPLEERARIFEICQSNQCGAFQGSSCGICGCGLHPERDTLNKIAWATTSCPHENAYWGPSEVVDVEITDQDMDEAVIEHEKEDPPKGCGCGAK